MLGTAVFQHFARSQSWERLFLPFSCVPKVGNNRFSRICSLPKLGTSVFAIFMCSQCWEQPFLCVYENSHPPTVLGCSAVKIRIPCYCCERDASAGGYHVKEIRKLSDELLKL